MFKDTCQFSFLLHDNSDSKISKYYLLSLETFEARIQCYNQLLVEL